MKILKKGMDFLGVLEERKMKHFEKSDSRNNLVVIKWPSAGVFRVHMLAFLAFSHILQTECRLYSMYGNEGVFESKGKSLWFQSISVLLKKVINLIFELAVIMNYGFYYCVKLTMNFGHIEGAVFHISTLSGFVPEENG